MELSELETSLNALIKPDTDEHTASVLREAAYQIKCYRREIAEFNAGYKCAETGGTLNDEPDDTTEDTWQIGYAWQQFR